MSTVSWEVREGDALERLREMPDESVQCCVTSPPYFGLRDYGVDGQIGLEATPDEFVAALVAVFREVRRVLRSDGTLWLNIGDSYSGSGPSGASYQSKTTLARAEGDGTDGNFRVSKTLGQRGLTYAEKKPIPVAGTKAKDLIGVPWMLAFALRADGWYLRSEIVWAKPNPMPESVRDRPTSAHEKLFLLSKRPRYFYDADAIREDAKDWSTGGPGTGIADTSERYGAGNSGNSGLAALAARYKRSRAESDYMGPTGERHAAVANGGRNKRNVWEIATQPYAEAHFATFPPKLVEPCILAGCPEGGTVLDPFAGAGTTGLVALRHGRSFVGIELNPTYAEMSRNRLRDDAPLLNTPAEVAA